MNFITEYITIYENPVAIITLNGDSENRFTQNSLIEFRSLLAKLHESEAAKGIIIASKNEKFFSSGLDLNNILKTPRENLTEELLAIIDFFYFLLQYPLPIISEIKGHALGAGAIIALGSDYRFMLDGHARIGFTEVHVGLPLPEPIIEKLKFTVHTAILHDIILLAKTLKGPDAFRCGLIHKLEANPELLRKSLKVKMKEILQIDENAFLWTKSSLNQSITQNYSISMAQLRTKLKNEMFIENLLSKIESILNRKK